MTVADDVGRAALAVKAAAVCHEEVADAVEVEAPLVAATVGEDFEFVPQRMVAPDGGADARALGVGRAGLADERVGEDAVAAVEPAVGPPRETVERLVRVLKAPAVEEDLRRTVGDVVVIFVGNEEQVRRRTGPHATEADLNAADEIQVFREDFFRGKRAVALRVLENQDAVFALALGLAVRITKRLRDPDASALVEAKRDRLREVGLGGDEFGLEAGDELHAGNEFLRGGVLHRGGFGGVVAQVPEHGARREARKIIDTRDALERRVAVLAGDADAFFIGRARLRRGYGGEACWPRGW